MLKQLQKMYEIAEQQNQSSSSSSHNQFPLTLSQQTKQKLHLIKLSQQQNQLPLDNQPLTLTNYLQSQQTTINHHTTNSHKKSQQQIQKQKQYQQGYGKGFNMLQKMGFNVMKGIGKNQQGRTNIIQAEFKNNLTARNQDYQTKTQQQYDKLQLSKKQKQLSNPFNLYQFQELFQYKSKNMKINYILITLKNKYQLLKNKLDIINKQTNSFNRDKQLSQNLQIQKINQSQHLNQQISNLEQLQSSITNIHKYPHLGLHYQADLLLLKQSINKLQPMTLLQINHILKSQTNKIKYQLNSLYLAKQKQSLKLYNLTTGFQLKIKGYFQKYNKDNLGILNPNTSLYRKDINQDQVTTVSPQNTQKIQTYLQLLLEQTILLPKLNPYLHNIQDISKCQQHILDIIQIICSLSQSLAQQLKQKYLIPLANSYLLNYKTQYLNKKLPHLVIFPWLLIIKLNQLNIHGFINNLITKLWPIQNYQLYNIIQPWFQYINSNQKQFFVNLYLTPRILYLIESFNFDGKKSGNSKDIIKGFIKYCQLIPINLRQQIIENSLALTILNKYQNQLQQSGQLSQDLRNWVLKWSQQLDKLCPGLLKKFFIQSNITTIW